MSAWSEGKRYVRKEWMRVYEGNGKRQKERKAHVMKKESGCIVWELKWERGGERESRGMEWEGRKMKELFVGRAEGTNKEGVWDKGEGEEEG